MLFLIVLGCCTLLPCLKLPTNFLIALVRLLFFLLVLLSSCTALLSRTASLPLLISLIHVVKVFFGQGIPSFVSLKSLIRLRKFLEFNFVAGLLDIWMIDLCELEVCAL